MNANQCKISVRIPRNEVDELSVDQIKKRLGEAGINIYKTIQFEEQLDGTRDMVYSQGGPCLCGKCDEVPHEIRTCPAVLSEVLLERKSQQKKWGEQNHKNGTGDLFQERMAKDAKAVCDLSFKNNCGTWMHILREEVAEAFAESDPEKLRAELIQVAAVAVAWVQAIDRRKDANSSL